MSQDAALQHALIVELKSAVCRCGKKKASMNSFCYRCFTSLPRQLRTDLYKRVGQGYEESYEKAVEILGPVEAR